MTIRRSVIAMAATALLVGGAVQVRADALKPEQGLAKASAKYVQGRTKALDKCENGKTKGQFPASTVCTSESKTSMRLGILASKLSPSIAKVCCGA